MEKLTPEQRYQIKQALKKLKKYGKGETGKVLMDIAKYAGYGEQSEYCCCNTAHKQGIKCPIHKEDNFTPLTREPKSVADILKGMK